MKVTASCRRVVTPLFTSIRLNAYQAYSGAGSKAEFCRDRNMNCEKHVIRIMKIWWNILKQFNFWGLQTGLVVVSRGCRVEKWFPEIQEGHWSGHLFDCWCQEHFLADRNMKQAENVGHPKKCRMGGHTFDLSAAVNSALNKLGNSVLYHKVSLVG